MRRCPRARRVGPFAHLRPGANLGAKARVGNFVELKKTTLGAGSKANHLAYLGDATIGAEVNVGAGTITCNYDGAAKHQTVIEDGAFVGSNSTLVAPVYVGREAYVAAGSAITRMSPPGRSASDGPAGKQRGVGRGATGVKHEVQSSKSSCQIQRPSRHLSRSSETFHFELVTV